MEDKTNKAVDLFMTGYNCAQSVLIPFAEKLGIPRETAARIATGFGGSAEGDSRMCGTVIGASMALGLKYGISDAGEAEKKKTTNEEVKQFIRNFTEHFGTINCRELLGVNVSTPEGSAEFKKQGLKKAKCQVFVEKSVKLLEKQLNL